jgi:hypothetical protein
MGDHHSALPFIVVQKSINTCATFLKQLDNGTGCQHDQGHEKKDPAFGLLGEIQFTVLEHGFFNLVLVLLLFHLFFSLKLLLKKTPLVWLWHAREPV